MLLRVEACQEAGATCRTDGRGRIGKIEDKTLPAQAVEVWRLDHRGYTPPNARRDHR